MLPDLVADMNIAAAVVRFLRSVGIDVISADEQGWHNLTDTEILKRAHARHRFVLTHDSDFGTLAIHTGLAFTGVIYLRPGNRPAAQPRR
jgi:predicted nuclease of predicted toxin-antitoxin system